MQRSPSRKRLIIIIGIIIFIGIILLIGFLARDTGKNQFGGRIKIQNYDVKVKNLSSDMRDSVEAYLYNIVKKNSTGDFDPSKVKDAYIRDNTASQNYDNKQAVYNGDFIVDMESIKQSYQTQYSYSQKANSTVTGGNPVVISCLPKEKLKYGAFNCTDFVSAQSTANDVLLQYLPYRSLSFSITPNATKTDKLTLQIQLTIPDIDLSGDANSKRSTVATYKQLVINWIISKSAEPDNYILEYNYDDNGNKVVQPNAVEGDI